MNGGNRWKVIMIVSLVFNFAVAGSLVYGWSRQSRIGMERAAPGEEIPAARLGMHLGRHIGLPQEKMASMGRIFDHLHGETTELRERLRTARGELVDLLQAEPPDEDAVMNKIDEISSIQGELEKLLMKRLLRVHQILDREEREQLLHLLQRRMHPGFHRRRGESGHHPGRMGGLR